MKDLIRKLIKEELEKKVYPVNWDLIDFENGKVKCYHYSSKSFDGSVKVNGVRGRHSKEEFKTWGRSRSFFYLTEGGIYFDKGISNTYKYISYIPINEIYDIVSNSNNYDKSGSWENLYKQTSEDGYSAWVYNLGGYENVPILTSFKDVPISEKYMMLKSGMYKLEGEELEDEVVGTIFKNGREMLVLQKQYYPIHVTNLYAIYPKDIDEKYRYESPIYDYQVRDIEFKDEFKSKYID